MEEDGLVIAIEVVFSNQPLSLAPQFRSDLPGADAKGTIVVPDESAEALRGQLRQAFSYVGCTFHVAIKFDDVTTTFEPEREDERIGIPIPRLSISSDRQPIRMPFDVVARSLFAASAGPGPTFEASLAEQAREAIFQQRYIDSFRYSFLLIEATYGDGKSRTRDLKAALVSSDELLSIVATESRTPLSLRWRVRSATQDLLDTRPKAEAVLGHLVDMRGYYFHSHRSGRVAWSPSDQSKAESLAVLALNIAQAIASQASSQIFSEAYSNLYFEEAERSGAITKMQVQFEFWEPGRSFAERLVVDIATPGTHVTSELAQYTLKKALDVFERNRPNAFLKSVTGQTNEGTEVFRVVINASDAPERTVDAPFQRK